MHSTSGVRVFAKLAKAVEGCLGKEIIIAEDIPNCRSAKRYLVRTNKQVYHRMLLQGIPSCYEVLLGGETML
jgi:hypothetical protein